MNGQAKRSTPLAGSSKPRNYLHMPKEPGSSGTASELGGTVAFLFSDLERGITELLRRLAGDYAMLLETHDRLLQEAFEQHGGRVVDSQADSFFVHSPESETQLPLPFRVNSPWPPTTGRTESTFALIGAPCGGAACYGEPRRRSRNPPRCTYLLDRPWRPGAALADCCFAARDSDLTVRLRDLGEHRLKDFEVESAFIS